MNASLDLRRILIFLALAFGIAWAAALVVYLTGGLGGSPALIPGTGITLAFVLIATVYMGAPALAHVFTRLLTREGWRATYLRPNLARGWPAWLMAWFIPAVLTILGLVIYFGVFPGYYDAELGFLRGQLAQVGQGEIDPWFVAIAATIQGVLIAPLINGLFTFGEEFGWRAYLLPRLMGLGGRQASLVLGVIWGVWHWPVIAMGHNYGLSYPGAPWLGMLAMTFFTITVGTFFNWLTLRGGSVWPAVIGHGAINGIASLGVLFTAGQPNPLLGPLPIGLIGGLPWAVLALVLFLRPEAWRVPVSPAPQESGGPAQRAPAPGAEALRRVETPPSEAELEDTRYAR